MSDPAAAPIPPAPPPSAGARVLEAIKSAPGVILGFAGVLVVAALAFLLVQQLTRHTVSIDPISVPEALSKSGYTDRVVAARLRDAIRHVVDEAQTAMPGSDVSLQSEAPDIVVPTLGIPLSAIGQVARSLFGSHSWHVVSGELTERDKRLWLQLRIDGRGFYASPAGIDPERPDGSLEPAAFAVLSATTPYIAAAFYADRDPEMARKVALLVTAKLPTTDPNVAWAYNLLGILYGKERPDDAERAFNKALACRPAFKEVHNNLGNLYLESGRPPLAITHYRRAIALDHGYALAHYDLCVALYDADPRRAQSECETAYALDHQVALPPRISREQTRADEKGAKLLVAIELGGGPATPAVMLGNALAAQGRWAEAEAEYRRAIATDPRNAAAENNLGAALDQQPGKSEGALAAFDRASVLDPELASPHLGKGTYFLDRDDLPQAEAEIRAAIALNPSNPDAYSNLGVALGRQGKTEPAEAAFRRTIELDPHRGDAHRNLGVALGREAKFKDEEMEYRRAIELDPRDYTAHYFLGFVLARNHATDAAIAEYRRALDLKPDYADAHIGLGIELGNKGDTANAVAALRRAVFDDPKNAGAHYDLGLALESAGETDAALDAYRRAIALSPDMANAHVVLALGLRRRGKTDDAIGEFREAIRVEPGNAIAHNDLGAALATKGMTRQAMDEYRRAIELDRSDPSAYGNLAWLLAASVTGQHPGPKDIARLSEACGLAETGRKLDPASPDFPAVMREIDWRFHGRGHCRTESLRPAKLRAGAGR